MYIYIHTYIICICVYICVWHVPHYELLVYYIAYQVRMKNKEWEMSNPEPRNMKIYQKKNEDQVYTYQKR